MAIEAPMAAAMKEIVVCKHCNSNEFYGELRWLNGMCGCRSCYKAHYQDVYHKMYTWDDLNYTEEELKQLKRGKYA